MSGIYLMDRSAGNHAVVKCLHPFFGALRIPFRVRRGYVEKRFAVAAFEGTRSIHGSFGRGALKWRRGFKDGWLAGWNGNNLLLFNEIRQPRKGIAECLQQLIRRGMLVLKIGNDFQY